MINYVINRIETKLYRFSNSSIEPRNEKEITIKLVFDIQNKDSIMTMFFNTILESN